MSDFLNDYYNFKIIESVLEYRKVRKELKGLNSRADELKRIGYALIDEYNRLVEIGDTDGIHELEKQIDEVSAQVDALSAEFDRFNNES